MSVFRRRHIELCNVSMALGDERLPTPERNAGGGLRCDLIAISDSLLSTRYDVPRAARNNTLTRPELIWPSCHAVETLPCTGDDRRWWLHNTRIKSTCCWRKKVFLIVNFECNYRLPLVLHWTQIRQDPTRAKSRARLLLICLAELPLTCIYDNPI